MNSPLHSGSARRVCGEPRPWGSPESTHIAVDAVYLSNQEFNLETEAVAQLIRAGIPNAEIQVSGDGRHFDALIVSAGFEGLTPIKRQRLVMETVKIQIASGELHALSIKTQTPAQQAAQAT